MITDMQVIKKVIYAKKKVYKALHFLKYTMIRKEWEAGQKKTWVIYTWHSKNSKKNSDHSDMEFYRIF